MDEPKSKPTADLVTTRKKAGATPNGKLTEARLRLLSPTGSGQPMSRQELAEAVNTWQWEHEKTKDHLDENDIGAYERGEYRWPRRRRRDGLRAVTGARTDAELGFYRNRRPSSTRATTAVAELPNHDGGQAATLSERVDRRALIKYVAAAGARLAVAPALMLDDLDRIEAVGRDSHGYGDETLVAFLTGKLAESAGDDGIHGPRYALPTVLGIISTVQRKARSVGWGARRPLMRVGAQASEFAGWLYRDLGHPVAAEYWRDRASEWAMEATDYAMPGYILVKKSQASWDNRDVARMLGLAEAAQEGPWRLPARIMAEAVQQQARGLAMMQTSRQKVDDTLKRARELLEQGAGEKSTLAAHYDGELFKLQTAICYGESGRPEKAAEIYEATLRSDVFSARDFGYFSALRAQNLASIQQPDVAASIGCTAFSAATMAGSVRTVQELSRLRDHLHPWWKRPAVASFTRLMEAV